MRRVSSLVAMRCKREEEIEIIGTICVFSWNDHYGKPEHFSWESYHRDAGSEGPDCELDSSAACNSSTGLLILSVMKRLVGNTIMKFIIWLKFDLASTSKGLREYSIITKKHRDT